MVPRWFWVLPKFGNHRKYLLLCPINYSDSTSSKKPLMLSLPQAVECGFSTPLNPYGAMSWHLQWLCFHSASDLSCLSSVVTHLGRGWILCRQVLYTSQHCIRWVTWILGRSLISDIGLSYFHDSKMLLKIQYWLHTRIFSRKEMNHLQNEEWLSETLLNYNAVWTSCKLSVHLFHNNLPCVARLSSVRCPSNHTDRKKEVNS